MLFRELLLAFPGLLGPITAPTRSTDDEIMRQISALVDQLPEAPNQSSETVDAATDEPGSTPQEQWTTDEEELLPEPSDNTDTDDTPDDDITPVVDDTDDQSASDDPVQTISDDVPVDTDEVGQTIGDVLDDADEGGQSSQADIIPVDDVVQQLDPVATTAEALAAARLAELPAEMLQNLMPTAPISMSDGAIRFRAEAGRVTILEPAAGDDDIASIRILTQGRNGHVSVNPDNSLALVMSEDPGNTGRVDFRYEVTYSDGRTQEMQARVNLTKGLQENGWGQGDFYMLEEGQDGRVVVEHGDNHRKVYITAGNDGLSRSDIARAEGISSKKITAEWLADHPEYGATEDMALNKEMGMALWTSITSRKEAPTSNWLLLDRGYDYGDLGRVIGRGSSGESALNPLFIGAYGEGAAPVIDTKLVAFQNTSQHVVVQGLDLTNGLMALQGENLLFDDLTITRAPVNLQNLNGLTLHDITILDVIKEKASSHIWLGLPDRISGAYISNSEGVLLEGLVVDHSGWKQGYAYNLSASKPQAPSMYSHNLYLQANNLDVTVRDTILMRGASFGMQLRSGGVIEDVISIDNNAALATLGGNYKNAGYVGNYSLYLDSLITSAGHKTVAAHQGALSMGLDGSGLQTSLVGNIVAHLADPNNAADIARKTITHFSVKTNDSAFYDDTIVYNWAASARGLLSNPNRGVTGMDTDVLDQTTIQSFTAQLLGKSTATIADLANYLRGQASGKLDHMVDADLVIAFFKEGFGVATDLRAEAETLRFAPDVRADGMRWDNRLNWSTGDLPGTQDGDSVDLGGNKVLFGAQTATVDDFIFGDYGQLKVSSGRLNVEGDIETGTANKVQITNAGQMWINGFHDSDQLIFNVEGGRLANTGDFTGNTALAASGQGQVLLAVSGGSFDLTDDSSLTVTGGKARVGFDGADSGPAVLRLQNDATINLVGDATGLGKITEFRSGAFGETSEVTSGVALDGTLKLNLKNLNDKAGGTWTLIDADQIIGTFDDVSISGLGRRQDALIRIDYVLDEVTLVLGAEGKGTGKIRVDSNGEADFINYTQDSALKDLWQALHSDAPHQGGDI